MKLLILAFAATLALSACATSPTLYQPAATPAGVGFSDYRIEPGRYRITFRGGSGAPMAQVSDYALLRAAELALQDGYEWFRVSDRFSEGAPDRSPRMSLGVGGGNFGYRGGVGMGVGTNFNLGGGPSLSTTIEVVMGRDARPSGLDIYDAREVRRTISQRV